MATVPVLISTEWLNEHINQASEQKLRILDVTWYSDKDAMQDFAKRHIPGAVYFNTFQGVELTPAYPRKLADAATFQMNARGSGVDNDSHVILCDGVEGRNGMFFGPRVWLMFKIYGHDKVSVLDGGLEKWMADGYEVTNMCMKVREGNFEAKSDCSINWVQTYEDLLKGLTTKDARPVFDSRPLALYKGSAEDPKSGHYPGAVNIPFTMVVDKKTGCLKTVDELKQIFKDVGINLSQPTTFMCNSGMSACSLVMAAHICGCQDVNVYMGGFKEWQHRAGEENIQKS